jgi:hypothetical protein
MAALDTTVAVYDDLTTADRDWSALESAAADGRVTLADPSLVQSPSSVPRSWAPAVAPSSPG